MLSAEWSGKLQALLETHAPIPKLQPMGGPVKPSDAADPSNFGMINTPVCLCACACACVCVCVCGYGCGCMFMCE